MKKGDLVRVVKNVPLPQFRDSHVGMVGVVINAGDEVAGMQRNEWVVIMLDGQFELCAKRNLEMVNAQD